MADKTYKVNPGDEIIITVPKKQLSGNEILGRRAAAPKAMIRSRRFDDSSPRRLQKKSLIEFYDLAQLLFEGSFYTINPQPPIETDYSYSPIYALGGENPQTGWFVDYESYTLAQFAEYVDYLLSFAPMENAGRVVKKSNADVFPLTVVGGTGDIEEPTIEFQYQTAVNTPNWTDDGLKLTAGERSKKFYFADDREYSIPFGTFVNEKITLTPDYDAAPVDNFQLAAKAKVILVPALYQMRAASILNLEGTRQRVGQVISGYRVKPRYFDAPGTAIETNSGDIDVYNRALVDGSSITTFRYERWFATPYIRAAVEANLALGEVFNDTDPFFTVEYFRRNMVTQQLAGIIYQNEQAYYFWQND